MNIQPIVEGFGEVEAFPILLRRLQELAPETFMIGIASPIRRHFADCNNKEKFQKGVELALRQESCGAVLILFDSEDFCPKKKAAELLSWARQIIGPRKVPCSVVLAHQEYESWFLAAVESLRGKFGISSDAAFDGDPEIPRNAKGRLESWMPQGRSYMVRIDQPRFTAKFDLKSAWRRSRSFRKLVSAFGEQVRALGINLGEWPPRNWCEE